MAINSSYLYSYALSLRNSRQYWKYLLSYGFSLILLFQVIATFCGFSIIGFIIYIIYIVLLWTLSIGSTFIFLQKFLKENRLIHWKGSNKVKKDHIFDDLEKIEENANKLSTNIEIQFINSWFHEISQDETFLNESRSIIRSTLKSVVKVMGTMDQIQLSYTVCNIFLKHIKEFKRSIKRKESVASKGKVLQLYRYSHSSMTTIKSQEYFIHEIVKSVLANYINWELWNSLPSQIVAAILSKQLSVLLLTFLSKPEFVNYYLLFMLLSEKKKTELNLNKYSFVHIVKPDDILLDEQNTKNTIDLSENDKVEITHFPTNPNKIEKSKSIEILPEKENKEVKIYEAQSANKRWNESVDFDGTISVGEDPLSTSFNESTMSEVLPKNIGKDIWASGDATVSTLNNIKDFQENTVNTVVKHKQQVSQATTQALHKIGDLQDEAAGMVEGLFDFGMAGLRKGLKLTGLQENATDDPSLPENKPKKQDVLHSKERKGKETPKSEIIEGDTVWVNPLDCDPNFIMASTPSSAELEDHRVPSILMEHDTNDSPDPEYEETADLASTIAKLRSLLQQKSSESAVSTPIVSPMPTDDVKNALELDEMDGVVPSFYKFCAKTATGVFNNTLNTLKTALPVNANEILCYDENTKWDYLEGDDKHLDLHLRMLKILHDRKDFCMVETAFDALDSQPNYNMLTKQISENSLFDELDEIESKIPLAISLVNIFCELVSDSKAVITREPIIKSILLIFGENIDHTVLNLVNLFIEHILSVTEIPTENKNTTLNLEMDTYVDLLSSCIPEYLKLLIGQTTIKEAFTLLISSLQIEHCNQDVVLQIMEFVALKLIEDSNKLSPPYSA